MRETVPRVQGRSRNRSNFCWDTLSISLFVAATDGNLSVRLDEERILATPTAMSKGTLRAADMVIVDPAGRQVAGRYRVSSEISMHLLIYKSRRDVCGIVHAHPCTATGFAAAGIALNQPLVCEVVIGLGSIPLSRYGTPGTSERGVFFHDSPGLADLPIRRLPDLTPAV